MFSVHGTQVSHITGRSRPPGKVGLTPRQYTEWNVVGRTRSTGDPSQQGLLPVVYCTASTERCAHLHDQVLNKPTNKQQETDPRSCARVVYIAGDSASSANGSRSHDCAPVAWAYGIPCPAMVSPNASKHKGGQAVVPGWSPYMVLESGFRPAHFPPLLSWSPTIVGDLQIILQPFFWPESQDYHAKYSI